MIRRVAVFALVGIVLAVVPAAVRSDAEASGSCTSTETSGTGAQLFATCVTDTGNVRKFVTPAGVDSFAAAGSGDSYSICDSETGGSSSARAWSRWGVDESNFSYPITHAPTVNVRKTADGRYTLTQTFVRDVTERQLVITMTLRNNGPGPVGGVTLQRAADINAGGTPSSDIFFSSYDSISAVDFNVSAGPGYGQGMMMSVLTPEIRHSTSVASYSNFNAIDFDSCSTRFSPENPSPPGDYVGVIRFLFDNIAAGESKTVKIVYQRF
jgi:hypothetical protein